MVSLVPIEIGVAVDLLLSARMVRLLGGTAYAPPEGSFILRVSAAPPLDIEAEPPSVPPLTLPPRRTMRRAFSTDPWRTR